MSRIAICSLRIGERYREITKYAPVNKQQYCDKHGYTYIEDDSVYDPSRHPAWSKLHLLIKHLENWDYLVWMDADLFIMNPDWAIGHFIKYLGNNADVMVGSDWKMSNTGIMFCRNTPWTMDFLKAILNNKDYPIVGNYEQDSFQDLFARNVMDSKDHVKVITRPEEINSYWFNYHRGQWILHCAGCRGEALALMMNRYCPCRMEEDSDESYAARMLWLEAEYRVHADNLLEQERRSYDKPVESTPDPTPEVSGNEGVNIQNEIL